MWRIQGLFIVPCYFDHICQSNKGEDSTPTDGTKS